MKEKRISKVGARWNQILADSERKLQEIQEKAEKEIKPKRTYTRKKKSVSFENDSDIGDIGVNIDEQSDCSENNFESEV